MPIYEYQCKTCDAVREVFHSMNDKSEQICPSCKTKVCRVVWTPPGTVIPPQHQASGSKLRYYGITNPRTGEGVEKLKKGWFKGEPGIT